MTDATNDTMTPDNGAAPDAAAPALGRTSRSIRAWAILLTVTVVGALFDLVTKAIAFSEVADQPVVLARRDVLAAGPNGIRGLIPPHEAVTVIPRVLEFRLVLNPGAVFGVGPGQRWFFVGFTLIAICMALWAFVKWTTPRSFWSHVGLGLILAGGLGNLYDRLMFGCVRDFLHPLPNVNLPFGWHWPSGATEVWPWVSNVADALLLIGIGLLVVHLWRIETPAKSVPADT